MTLARGSGDVIFVPRADGTVYAATKHALTAVAEGLRMEVHTKRIRVISVEPGLVRTDGELVPERTRILRAERVLSPGG